MWHTHPVRRAHTRLSLARKTNATHRHLSQAAEARAAGADIVGDDDLIQQISGRSACGGVAGSEEEGTGRRHTPVSHISFPNCSKPTTKQPTRNATHTRAHAHNNNDDKLDSP